MSNRAQILNAALNHIETGRPAAAIAALEALLRKNPRDADAHALLGQARGVRGEAAAAIESLEAAMRLRPDRAGFAFNLGAAYLNAGRHGDAVRVLTPLLERAPDDAALLEALGAAHLGLREPEQAQTLLDRAIAGGGARAATHTHLGDALQKLGQGADAESAYRRALTLDAAYVPALNNLGALLLDAGRYEEAEEVLRKAAAHNPRHTRALNNLGLAQLHQGEAGRALKSFEKALAADPMNRWSIAYRDLTRLELGQMSREDFAATIAPLVTSEDLSPPFEGFETALADELNTHPNRRWDVTGTATTNGYDALDLFAHKGPALEAFEQVLRAAIDRRVAAMPFDRGHPLHGWKPESYRLDIWATFLKSSGYQYAHIHPTGWLSGVYYVQLPKAGGTSVMGRGGANNDVAGWIEFGPPDESFPVTVRPDPLLLEPKVGRVFMFPSYAYHRTVPFASETERISIAFDVRP